MNLQDFRQQYPEYNDLSDTELAKGLHQKFYSDIPFDQFAGQVGLDTTPVVKQTKPNLRSVLKGTPDTSDIVADQPQGEGLPPVVKQENERIKKRVDERLTDTLAEKEAIKRRVDRPGRSVLPMDTGIEEPKADNSYANENPMRAAAGKSLLGRLAGVIQAGVMGINQAETAGNMLEQLSPDTVIPDYKPQGLKFEVDENGVGQTNYVAPELTDPNQAGWVPAINQKMAELTSDIDAKKMGEVDWGNPEEATDWLAVKFAGAAPDAVMSVAAAFNPALATPYLTSMGASSAGSQYAQLRGQGVEPGRAMIDATLNGLIEAGSERIGLDALSESARRIFVSQAFRDSLASKVAGLGSMMIVNAGIEGTEEAAAQVGQNAVDSAVLGERDNILEGVGESFVVGTLGGVGAGGLASAAANHQATQLDTLQAQLNRLNNYDQLRYLNDDALGNVLSAATQLNGVRPNAVDAVKIQREIDGRKQAKADQALVALTSQQPMSLDDIRAAALAAVDTPLTIQAGPAVDVAMLPPEPVPEAVPYELGSKKDLGRAKVPQNQLLRYYDLLRNPSQLPMDRAFITDVESRLEPETADILKRSVTSAFTLDFGERRKLAETLYPKPNFKGLSDEAITFLAGRDDITDVERRALDDELQKRKMVPEPSPIVQEQSAAPGYDSGPKVEVQRVSMAINESGTYAIRGEADVLEAIRQDLRNRGISSWRTTNNESGAVLTVSKQAPQELVQQTVQAVNGPVVEADAPPVQVPGDDLINNVAGVAFSRPGPQNSEQDAGLARLTASINRQIEQDKASGIKTTAQAVDLRELTEDEVRAHPAQASLEAARAVGRAFGKRVVFIRDRAGQKLFFDGIYNDGLDQNAVYVDANSSAGAHRVTAHEILHALRTQAPDVYKVLERGLRPIIDKKAGADHLAGRGYGSQEELQKDLADNTGDMQEELVADVFSDVLLDPAALDELLGKMQPSVAQKFLTRVRLMLDKALAAVRGLGSDTYADLVKARQHVIAAAKEYARRVEAGQIEAAEVDDESQFARKQTETPEFKRWFGDSKVVDAKGKPLVVYHGTNADFDTFDKNKIGSVFNSDKAGFFFTSSPRIANDYAEWAASGGRFNRADGANIMPAYVSLKNPMTLEDYKAATNIEFKKPNSADPDDLTRFFDAERDIMLRVAKTLNKDGILLESNGNKLVAAFRPEQIKSAIGNNGDFDPANPDIRYARKPTSDIGHKRRGTDGSYVGAPDWISSPASLAVLRRKLKSLAEEGESGRFWYERSSKAVLDLVGGDKADAEKFVGLLAIYSQGTEVGINLGFALEAYYQWKAGVPIHTGRFPTAQTKKAEPWLKEGKDWGGIKTNNFYADLMEEIDPKKVDADHATMDMWMAIAFDYGDKKLDQGPKYNFAKREIKRLADELGWKSHQVQAAIWTSIKTRVESTEKKRNTLELAKGIGEKNGNAHAIVKGREYDHFRLAHKLGMELAITPEEIAAKGFDFADALDQRVAQLSWEATPSVTGGDLPGIHSASTEAKMEYLVEISKVLAPKGRDQIADMIGLHTPPTVFGYSAWEGAVGAGAQSFLPVPITGQGKERAVLPVARELLNLYAAIKGYVLKQDAVVWHIPVYGDAMVRANGFEISGTRPFTEGEFADFYQAIIEEFGTTQLAPGYTQTGARVLNFEDTLDNQGFQSRMRDVVKRFADLHPEALGGMFGIKSFRSDGDYIGNDWKESPNGEDYRSRFGGSGRPDLQGRADDLRARVKAVNQDFAKRYGWGDPQREAPGVRFSRKRLSVEEGRKLTALYAEVLKRVGEPIFTYPRSDKTTLEGVAEDVSKGQIRSRDVSFYNDDGRQMDALSIPVIRDNGTIDHKDAFVTDDGDELWINIAGSEEGAGGSRVYSIVGNYAFNTGKVFIGDPDGITYAGMTRRLQNMLSLALKFGTTEFMRPHPKQLQLFADYGLDWRTGDDQYNLQSMLLASYNLTLDFAPEIADVDYNFTTGRFEKAGEPLDEGYFQLLAERSHSSLRAGAPGSRSLKVAGLTGTLLRMDRGGVDQIRVSAPDSVRADRPLEQILYKRKETVPPVFYSQLARSIEEAKTDTQPANQWALWLKANKGKLGIKDDELQWTGVLDWLETQGKAKTSKADIVAYLDQGGVRVEEVLKGANDVRGKALVDGEEFELNGSKYRLDVSDAGYELVDGWGTVVETSRTASEMADIINGYSNRSRTEYHNYALPGAKEGSYRELLLTLPTVDPRSPEQKEFRHLATRMERTGLGGEDLERLHTLATSLTPEERVASGAPDPLYSSSHWKEPNILAHVRFNERRDAEGNRVLFLEELQSDWGQAGRDQGFDSPKQFKDMRVPLDDELDLDGNWMNTQTVRTQTGGGIPTAPFVTDTKAWTALALKRMLRWAVDNGYDAIAWPTGRQQADRYSLAKVIEYIEYEQTSPGKFYVRATDHRGGRPVTEYQQTPEQLAKLFGKEVADKIVNNQGTREPGEPKEYGLLRTKDLVMGGEGMKSYYEGIVPQVANDILKKLGGGRVEQLKMNTTREAEDTGVRGRQHPFMVVSDLGSSEATVENRFTGEVFGPMPYTETSTFISGKLAEEERTAQPGFKITDAMREKVSQGLPMFARKPGFAPGPATFNGPDTSLLDDLLYKFQDKHVDTKRVVEAIQQTKGQIQDWANPYLQEELYHGRTAKRVEDFLDDELRPLLREMQMRGVEIPELEEYLWARHAKEANAHIAAINPGLQDGGSGMTDQDADDYMNNLDPAKRKAYDVLAKRVDAMIAKTRQLTVGYQLESQDTVNRWSSTYQHYVPLHREDVGSGPGTGQGFSVRGPASKRRTGSTRGVVDILGNIAMQRERTIVRGEKNRVALAVFALAKMNPNPDFWQADIAPTEQYVDDRSGLVQTRVVPNYQSRDNVILTRLADPKTGDIVQHYVLFNDYDERALRMVQALKNLDMDDLGGFLGMVGRVTRYFASVNTQYNPIFGILNFTRDTQGALFNLSTTPIAGKQKRVTGYTLSAVRGIYLDVRAIRKGQHPSSSWAQLWEEFQKEGGQTGYRDAYRTSGDRERALVDELKAMGRGTLGNAARAKAVFEWLSDYNETMENAVRLAAYKVALEEGLSKQQAASIAKNLTVNFNRKGQATTQLGALYAFFNASVQGTARLAKTLTGPRGRAIVSGGILLGVMQALASSMAGFGDEEPPEFVRERNIVIPLFNDAKGYVTIPMPLGFHVLPNIGRILTEWALDGFKKPTKRAIDLFNVLIESFNPLGASSLSQAVTPTVLDPALALWMNEDWTGRPITREDFNQNRPTPGFTRAKDTATSFSKELSYYLNLASGGTEYTAGEFSPTPDQIDYLIGQVTGGVGREISKVDQLVSSTVTGEDLPLHKVPLVGRFYGEATGRSSEGAAFYENLRRFHEHELELKGRREDGLSTKDYRAENPEVKFIPFVKAQERKVREMNKRRRELIEQGAPRDRVKLLEEQVTREMKRLNDRVREE